MPYHRVVLLHPRHPDSLAEGHTHSCGECMFLCRSGIHWADKHETRLDLYVGRKHSTTVSLHTSLNIICLDPSSPTSSVNGKHFNCTTHLGHSYLKPRSQGQSVPSHLHLWWHGKWIWMARSPCQLLRWSSATWNSKHRSRTTYPTRTIMPTDSPCNVVTNNEGWTAIDAGYKTKQKQKQ